MVTELPKMIPNISTPTPSKCGSTQRLNQDPRQKWKTCFIYYALAMSTNPRHASFLLAVGPNLAEKKQVLKKTLHQYTFEGLDMHLETASMICGSPTRTYLEPESFKRVIWDAFPMTPLSVSVQNGPNITQIHNELKMILV